jgi:hypothetical protein
MTSSRQYVNFKIPSDARWDPSVELLPKNVKILTQVDPDDSKKKFHIAKFYPAITLKRACLELNVKELVPMRRGKPVLVDGTSKTNLIAELQRQRTIINDMDYKLHMSQTAREETNAWLQEVRADLQNEIKANQAREEASLEMEKKYNAATEKHKKQVAQLTETIETVCKSYKVPPSVITNTIKKALNVK